jgi:hypothetical protein
MPKLDCKGKLPESWCCLNCGVNTAPGLKNRAEAEQAFQIFTLLGKEDEGVSMKYDDRTEVYQLRDAVWKATGMKPMGGCLCIGCVEKRIGRKLRAKDFAPDHVFNRLPGTPRLMERRQSKNWQPPRGQLPNLPNDMLATSPLPAKRRRK